MQIGNRPQAVAGDQTGNEDAYIEIQRQLHNEGKEIMNNT